MECRFFHLTGTKIVFGNNKSKPQHIQSDYKKHTKPHKNNKMTMRKNNNSPIITKNKFSLSEDSDDEEEIEEITS